ncbi:hypothetical protein [Streptomyces syringium]|uniref:hypothetical protein n=1 Tax=Streptomyces syringium TaxID=76729 RepID=UPI0033E47D82
MLELFKAYLNARFLNTSEQVSGTRLFLEIRERGYQESRVVLCQHLAALREGTAELIRTDIPSSASTADLLAGADGEVGFGAGSQARPGPRTAGKRIPERSLM